jgi:hypothetical protein
VQGPRPKCPEVCEFPAEGIQLQRESESRHTRQATFDCSRTPVNEHRLAPLDARRNVLNRIALVRTAHSRGRWRRSTDVTSSTAIMTMKVRDRIAAMMYPSTNAAIKAARANTIRVKPAKIALRRPKRDARHCYRCRSVRSGAITI